MATQGTTEDFMALLNAMKEAGQLFVPPGKILFIYDQPGVFQKAIGMVIDDPHYTGGGMDAPID